ncbi:MAG: ATP-binding cassette domain-containing protein [Betaproteobacteria bacterium]|nr:ATP-binding cassette domain-containing protein [Betaproteobacteria bacterium]
MNSPAIVEQDALRIDLPDHPTLAAPAGTHIVVTGPSGTGKTTFCLLIAGVSNETIPETHVHLFGNPLNKIPFEERACCIGLVPSD